MTNHIMVDLETMGTGPDASILSIGACVFDPRGTGLIAYNSYYRNITLASCMKAGLSVTAETIEFWMDQPEAAREALKPDRWAIHAALRDFSQWVHSWADNEGKAFRIWAHGSTFDIVILESAYRICELERPWAYNVMRDDRTLLEVAGVDLKDFQEGTFHNALDDARNQAMAVQASYRKIKIA